MPAWRSYQDRIEKELLENPSRSLSPPLTLFEYVAPWRAKATVLRFPETPGPRPASRPAPLLLAGPARTPGVMARLFGRAAPAVAAPERARARRDDAAEATAALALWEVASVAAHCRRLGYVRAFGRYDGDGDGQFTSCEAIVARDGARLEGPALRPDSAGVDGGRLVEQAVAALMGRFDAGPFLLRGAVGIDFDACTITDEQDPDIVFPEAASGADAP
jgi:hypothetical protein